MKLPLREAELDALLAALAEWDGYVSSALLGLEAIRACSRYGSHYATEARSLLSDVALLPVEDSILERASLLEPAGLRSLDALHLATALSIREDVGFFFTYDLNLAEAAAAQGLQVLAPV